MANFVDNIILKLDTVVDASGLKEATREVTELAEDLVFTFEGVNKEIAKEIDKEKRLILLEEKRMSLLTEYNKIRGDNKLAKKELEDAKALLDERKELLRLSREEVKWQQNLLRLARQTNDKRGEMFASGDLERARKEVSEFSKDVAALEVKVAGLTQTTKAYDKTTQSMRSEINKTNTQINVTEGQLSRQNRTQRRSIGLIEELIQRYGGWTAAILLARKAWAGFSSLFQGSANLMKASIGGLSEAFNAGFFALLSNGLTVGLSTFATVLSARLVEAKELADLAERRVELENQSLAIAEKQALLKRGDLTAREEYRARKDILNLQKKELSDALETKKEELRIVESFERKIKTVVSTLSAPVKGAKFEAKGRSFQKSGAKVQKGIFARARDAVFRAVTSSPRGKFGAGEIDDGGLSLSAFEIEKERINALQKIKIIKDEIAQLEAKEVLNKAQAIELEQKLLIGLSEEDAQEQRIANRLDIVGDRELSRANKKSDLLEKLNLLRDQELAGAKNQLEIDEERLIINRELEKIAQQEADDKVKGAKFDKQLQNEFLSYASERAKVLVNEREELLAQKEIYENEFTDAGATRQKEITLEQEKIEKRLKKIGREMQVEINEKGLQEAITLIKETNNSLEVQNELIKIQELETSIKNWQELRDNAKSTKEEAQEYTNQIIEANRQLRLLQAQVLGSTRREAISEGASVQRIAAFNSFGGGRAGSITQSRLSELQKFISLQEQSAILSTRIADLSLTGALAYLAKDFGQVESISNQILNLQAAQAEIDANLKTLTRPQSILGQMFGLDRLSEEEAAIDTSLSIIEKRFTQFVDFWLSEQTRRADLDVSIQERRLDRAVELFNKGNAEALNAEDKKLDELLAIREKAAADQRKFAALQVAANQAIAISEVLKAAAEAASNPVKIAFITAAIVTGLSAAAQIGSAFSDIPAFFEGTDTDVRTALGAPDVNGRDGYLIRADGREKILAPIYAEQVRDMNQRELVSNALFGKAIAEGRLNSKITSKIATEASRKAAESVSLRSDVRALNRTMGRVERNLENLGFSVNVDKSGFMAALQKRVDGLNRIKRIKK